MHFQGKLIEKIEEVLSISPTQGLKVFGRDLLIWITETWGGNIVGKTHGDHDNQTTINLCLVPQNEIGKVNCAEEIIHVWCTLKENILHS